MRVCKRSSVREAQFRYWGVMLLALLTASDPAIAITGGFPDTQPWLVKVIGWNDNPSGAGTLCTGTAINEQIVITASHCKANTVVYGKTAVSVYGAYDVAGTDITLLMLGAPHPLADYPRLWAGQDAEPQLFPAGTSGMGYGFDADNRDEQKRLLFNLKSYENTGHSTEVFYMNNANGALEGGDSGGPLFINGSLVGIVHASADDPEEGSAVFIYHAIPPALERIGQLDYQRKVRVLAAIVDDE